jgi:hypothetical protein
MDIAAANGRGRIRFESSGNIGLKFDSSFNLTVGNGYVQVGKQLFPSVTGTIPLGTDTNRWSEVASVDGSFTGNLVSEVGGSYKLYNLGADGDTDTEYLDMSWNNYFEISTQRTGSGAGKGYKLIAGTSRIQTDYSGNITLIAPNTTVLGNLSSNGSVTTGGLKTAIAGTLSSSITLATTDHTVLCDCQLNNISVNLPTAVGNDGQVFVIKKVDATANFVTIFASGAETIDGGSIHIINTQNESIHVQAYSGDWYII